MSLRGTGRSTRRLIGGWGQKAGGVEGYRTRLRLFCVATISQSQEEIKS